MKIFIVWKTKSKEFLINNNPTRKYFPFFSFWLIA